MSQRYEHGRGKLPVAAKGVARLPPGDTRRPSDELQRHASGHAVAAGNDLRPGAIRLRGHAVGGRCFPLCDAPPEFRCGSETALHPTEWGAPLRVGPHTAQQRRRSDPRCKSRGAELADKAHFDASGVSQEGERKRYRPMKCRKRSDDIKTGVVLLPCYEPGGYLLTDQVVSGIKVARAWFRLWCETWEPGPRYCLAVQLGEQPPGRRERDL